MRTEKRNSFVPFAVAFAGMLVMVHTARAAASARVFAGAVRDASGGAAPRAALVIKNLATRSRITAPTNLVFPLTAARLEGSEPLPLGVQPISEPEHSVHVTAAALGAAWRLSLPERVLADANIILIDHHDAPVTWKGNAVKGLAAAGGKSPISFRVEARAADNGLTLLFRVENRGDETLHNVVGHVCLSHDHSEQPGGERFADPRHERTYVVTAQGLVNLQSLDRGGPPDGIRSHYLVVGASPISFFSTLPFWGKLSKVQVTEPWIAGTSVAGDWTVAIWWERAAELFQNSDQDNRCIHSDPAFGNLDPGRSVTIRGGLDLVHGTPQDALRIYHQERLNLK
jgi:hypothetical protein